MLSAVQVARFLNQTFLQSKSMKQPHFLYVDINLQKLKVDWKVFGGAWSKRLWLTWFLEELMELTDFLHAVTVSHKLKGDWKFFGLAWWKMGVASHKNKKMNRWNKVIFFHAGTNSGKPKVNSVIFGWMYWKIAMTF